MYTTKKKHSETFEFPSTLYHFFLGVSHTHTTTMAGFIGLNTRPVARATDEEKAFIAKYATVSPEEHRRIMLLDQHHADGTTNQEWLDARKHRFTGSTAGAGCHQNPYETQDDFLTKKVEQTPMDERGLAMCKWGNDHEDDAEAAFGEMIEAQIGKPQKNGLTFG